MRAIAAQLGAIQIDSVNVLVRSQYLPYFARIGAYDRTAFDRLAYGKRRSFFEYWGHEASLLPLDLYPYFGWRRARARDGRGTWKHVAEVGRENKDVVQRVLRTVAERGPIAASDLQEEKGGGSWWGWSDAKRALEYLFWCGDITTVTRRNSFERLYGLSERVIPKNLIETTIPEPEQYAALVETAARAYGVATPFDLRDYFRLPVEETKAAIARLVEEGALLPVTVEGWSGIAYRHRDARVPRAIDASALLSPFDSLVWNRQRLQRLFDFHYRIEIYTPAHKRVHGYYVLPYLLGDRLVARVDAKADRARSRLLVHAVHYEPGEKRGAVLSALREDLNAMADWLNLERVVFSR